MALKGLLDLPEYHVAEGSVDARGWPLYDASDEQVGRIVDLIVDTRALEARYLLVALDDLFREVVIAIKEVDFDLKTRRAVCRHASRQQIEQLPYLGGTSLKPEDEHRLFAAFATEDAGASLDGIRSAGVRPGDASSMPGAPPEQGRIVIMTLREWEED